MNDMIHVRPAAERREDFARWAVRQNPKIRTVGPSTFAVPPDAFVAAPEDILIGALVDGRRYVSPVEDAELGRPKPGAPELLGVATEEGLAGAVPEQEAVPGVQLPPVPEDSYGPDAVPLELAPLEDAPGEQEPDGSDPSDPPSDKTNAFACDLCPREFTTERGRDTHRRQAHPEA